MRTFATCKCIQGCYIDPSLLAGLMGGAELVHSLLALGTCNQQFGLPPPIITHCLKLGGKLLEAERPIMGPVH